MSNYWIQMPFGFQFCWRFQALKLRPRFDAWADCWGSGWSFCATGGAVRGWDFGLVGERPNPFPPQPSHPLVGANGLCAKPEFFIDGAPAETAYVSVRVKASDPLACYACGSLDGHDENCPVGFLVNLLTGGTATLHIPARPSIISKLMAPCRMASLRHPARRQQRAPLTPSQRTRVHIANRGEPRRGTLTHLNGDTGEKPGSCSPTP